MKLLTTPEVAKRLGITLSRVQALIAEHRLPAQKLGRDLMVREEDLRLVSTRSAGRTPAAIQLDYWTAFVRFLRQRESFFKLPTPEARRLIVLETIRGCRLAASIHLKDRQIWVDLTFPGDAKKYFNKLEKNRAAIEGEFGEELEWLPRSDKVDSWILIRNIADPGNGRDWHRQHTWLAEKLELFSKAFRSRLLRLR